MTRSYGIYEGTALWLALERALAELETSGELTVRTAPEYVIAYLCQELVAKKAITSAALESAG
jgi:hypothetical protein